MRSGPHLATVSPSIISHRCTLVDAVKTRGAEFVRRFLLHVLPKGVKRIRHYGLLAAGCKVVTLVQARAALAMPAPNPLATESTIDFMRRIKAMDALQCPCCALGRLKIIQTVPAPARLPAPGAQVQASGCRGPPHD